MNKEIADKWTKELRSDKYRQGKRMLKTAGNEFCCLGVLCEIYHAETKEGKWEWGGWNDKKPHFMIDNEVVMSMLPDKVLAWAEMKDELGSFIGTDKVSLASYNDSGYTFKEIADIIEADWQLL